MMASSALFMGALGIAASFFSHELLRLAGAAVRTPTVLLMQVCGALYVGFAFLNWYLRGFVIGGIYNRPLALANLLHFAVVAVTLVNNSSTDVTSNGIRYWLKSTIPTDVGLPNERSTVAMTCAMPVGRANNNVPISTTSANPSSTATGSCQGRLLFFSSRSAPRSMMTNKNNTTTNNGNHPCRSGSGSLAIKSMAGPVVGRTRIDSGNG